LSAKGRHGSLPPPTPFVAGSGAGLRLRAAKDAAIIHRRFEMQATLRPEATAIWDPRDPWRYDRLEAAANRLARFLTAEGVRPEDCVGLRLKRGPELIVALLATLKAGAAYLPLESNFPSARIRRIAEDARPRLILDCRPSEEPRLAGAPILGLDAALKASVAYRADPLDLTVYPEQRAYVMYTSGSTGAPKGVVATHRNVVSLILQGGFCRLGADETLLHAASISFDASTFEVWGALLHGGCLALAPEENLETLPDLIRQAGVTALWLTGQLFNAMVDEHPEALARTRQVLAGGEALSPRHVKKFLDLCPETALINGYGPTEATTFSACCPLHEHGLVDGVAPIGAPLPYLSANIVDERLHPVAAGEEGELLVGGDGLTRGYLNRPDLTALRFTPNPRAHEPGDRVYRTGDRVRRLTNGLLMIHGRHDHQVKIRGFRVELGEIEAALRRCQLIAETAVTAMPTQSGSRRLIAYVALVPSCGVHDEAEATNRLREFLRASLPDFMIPSQFVVLDRFPVNVQGKLDRAALPEPPPLGGDTEHDAPRTKAEGALLSIWRQALGVNRIGVHDRFFDMGGDSIHVIRIVAEARRAGFELTARRLFDNPTVAELAAQTRTVASPSKSSDDNLFAADGLAPETLAILRARYPNAEDAYPATPMQQGMLFHSALDGQAHVYRVQLSFVIEGALNPAAFQAAWQDVIDRHAVLRTVFYSDADRTLQIPLRRFSPAWTRRDWRDCGPEGRNARLEDFLKEDLAAPFRLDERPPLRFGMLRQAARTWEFVFTFHHALLDGWSVSVLLWEVSRAYSARQAGALPEWRPARPFRDFVIWLARRDADADKRHWRNRLASCRTRATLPTPPPSHNAPTALVTRATTLDRTKTIALQAFARRERLTLNSLVQGAWALLLARICDCPEALFGVTVSGRPAALAEIDRMVGLFINTLPLRVDVPRRIAPADWLRSLQEGHVADRERETAPLAEVQTMSGLPPGEPLFDSVLVFENYPPDEALGAAWGGLRFGPIREREDANYPLVWQILPGENLTVSLRYDPSRVDPAVADPAPTRLAMLLTALSDAACLSRISILEKAERGRLHAWSQGKATARPAESWFAAFETQARRTPHRIAVSGPIGALTYGALEARANALAARLRRQGAGPECPVGVCLQRGTDLAAALLAVHKAGAVYVPLDPDHPDKRLALMAGAAKLRLILTEPAWRRRMTALGEAVMVGQALEQTPPTQFQPPSSANLAYIMFTSGSTGKPKGVALSHAALANRLLWARDAFPLNAADRFLHASSIGFDIALWELAAPLLAGARAELAPPGALRDPALLAEFLARRRVTAAHFTPSQLRAFLGEPAARPALAALRRVFCGGEALAPDLARSFAAACRAELHHFYGPTEAAINMTSWPCPPHAAAIPLGRPIDNCRLLALDRRGQPRPPGAPGELHIGGICLARGYIGRPDLTADAFRPDPDGNGARLYRSGDLGCWSAAGEARFLGRRDQQLKIRGVRIEPAEVEAALTEHAKVAEALVMALDFGRNDRRLTAYYRCLEGEEVDPDALRRFLRERLPPAMQPSRLMPLAAFPLDANGKIDRRALPHPADTVVARPTVREPSSPTAEVLAHIWEDALRVKGLGVDADFFALGGHSLLAARVAARIREVFRIPFRVRAVFDCPILRDLAARVETALDEGREETETPPTPLPAGVEPPLSFAQERLWFLDRLTPDTPGYNMPFVFEWLGPMDPRALETAFRAIIARHQPLRARFADRGGRPVQRFDERPSFHIRVVDLADLAEPRRTRRLRALLIGEARRPFNLARGPLLRASLSRRGAERWTLMINLHHIAADAWSLKVLLRELALAYAAALQGKPLTLPPLPIQYADYAHWQRLRLRGDRLESLLNFWESRLRGAPALTLPTDHPRPGVQRYRGRMRRFRVDGADWRALQSLRDHERATAFMALLAAWGAFLWRYSGQTDISIGAPVANRARPELEPLIGLFVNSLVLRLDLDDAPSFRRLLDQARSCALDAYAHRAAPFEQIVARLRPSRDLARSPLFQAFFSLETADHEPTADIPLPLARLRPIPFDCRLAKFDLSLHIVHHADGLDCRLEYSADLFHDQTAARFAANFQAFLAGMTARPDTPLDRLSPMTEIERRQILRDWNQTAAAAPNSPIHEQIAAQARRTPGAPAVVSDAARLEYGEFMARVEALAARLTARGAGPEQTVAVALRRDVHIVVGLLAVLRSGAAYAPLDPELPMERLRFIVQDAGAAIALVDETTEEAMAPLCPNRLRADQAMEKIEAAPRVDIDSARAAYLIYTSGSTGRPKGVVVPHGALGNFIAAMARRFPLQPGDRMLAATTLSFDISALEIYLPLTRGATVVVADRDTAADGERLAETLVHHGVSHFQATPTAWRLLAESGWPGAGHLTALCGGEPLPDDLARSLAHGCASLWNLYGPTETTVWSTAARLDEATETIHIGAPIENTETYILDARAQPAPLGAIGELFIGGMGLARGYHLRPDLTAESFIPDPFSGRLGARLYKTGDLARWLACGKLRCLGRRDGQVKVRGHRIEPGEIEAVLRSHPAVSEAAVVVHGAGAAARLAAYVATDAEDQASLLDDLRALLTRCLPAYMIPAHLAALPRLPQTANGKLDRRALPLPEQHRADGVRQPGYVAPRNEVEAFLAEIWAEVLGLPKIGVHADFFELGGHSLLATRAAARIRQRYPISLRALFQNPILADLARHLERAPDPADIPPLTRRPADALARMSFAQERLWFLEQLQTLGGAYNLPLVLRLRGALDVAALERAVGRVARRHETLRTRFPETAEEPLAFLPGPPELTVMDCRGLANAEDAALARLADDAIRPFNLTTQAPLRHGLYLLPHREALWLAVMHHIVGDARSLEILTEETRRCYRAETMNVAVKEDALPLQYADFAAWERHWQEKTMSAALTHWRERLAAPPTLDLPLDAPRPPVQTYRGDRVPFAVPDETAQALLVLAKATRATPFMALLAVYATLLARWTGQTDILIGAPIDNRGHRQTENLIGFFANTLVFRFAPHDCSFQAWLRRVRDEALDAFSHRHTPFSRIVEDVQPERDMSRTPLFQALFSLERQAEPPRRWPELTVDPQPFDYRVAKFDISLDLVQSDDGIAGWLEYNADLLARESAARMTRCFVHLLENLVRRPNRSLEEAPMLNLEERRQAWYAWNRTERDYPRDTPLHLRFRAMASRYAAKPALLAHDGAATYAELDQISDRVAAALAARGVGPETRVAVCLPRSSEQVAALLGVLKAGGAYVPLDADNPAERTRLVLADAGATLALTDAEPPSGLEHIPCLDIAAALACKAESPSSEVDARQLAYVMFTSGSTGRPKGVAVAHRNVMRLVFSDCARFGADRVFLHASASAFDASTFEIWGALLHGATLVLAPPGDVAGLPALIKARGVDTMWLTGQLFNLMVDEHPDALANVDQVLAGGEALSPDHVRRFLAGARGRLINGYGPTEGTTFTCCCDLRERGLTPFSAPMGGPIANTTAVVLDKRLEPVPLGVFGELFIGGDGLARGYLNRPELTAERFIPHPSPTKPGERLYRSGDLVRRLDDGALEFRGRRDAQVKLRGYRIELGEVEAALRACDGVTAAAAIVREDAPGERRLVAYVQAPATPDVEARLKAALAQKLPPYMRPAFIVPLERLPRTRNDKLDVKALPRPERPADAAAPASDIQRRLAAIWRAILGLARVGLNDNFFDLGGNSLTIVKLQRRLSRDLQRDIPLVALFEHPTVGALAAYLERGQTSRQDATAENRARQRKRAFRKKPARRK